MSASELQYWVQNGTGIASKGMADIGLKRVKRHYNQIITIGYGTRATIYWSMVFFYFRVHKEVKSKSGLMKRSFRSQVMGSYTTTFVNSLVQNEKVPFEPVTVQKKNIKRLLLFRNYYTKLYRKQLSRHSVIFLVIPRHKWKNPREILKLHFKICIP